MRMGSVAGPRGEIHSAAMPEPIPIIGGTGALGWGLALRLARVGRTVPTAAAVSGKATRSLGVWQGSAAQQAQEMVPDGVTVVAALHTVSAPMLGDPDEDLDEDVLICGDRKADKARVARIVGL